MTIGYHALSELLLEVNHTGTAGMTVHSNVGLVLDWLAQGAEVAQARPLRVQAMRIVFEMLLMSDGFP